MKEVPLYDLPGMKSVHIIRQALELAPQPGAGRAGGINIADMRARCRVLDLLDGFPIEAVKLTLEDSDHSTLVRAINDMQWAVATPSLLKIIDGVLEAKEAV